MNKFILWSRGGRALLPRKAENWSVTNTRLEEFGVVPNFVGAEASGSSEAGLGVGAETVREQG